MFHRRPSRIRPVRPQRSPARVVSLSLLAAVVAFWSATAWFDRSDESTIRLAPAGPYRVRVSSGPIEVRAADGATDGAIDGAAGGAGGSVNHRSSWLVRGPRVSGLFDGSADLVIGCPTRFPCRTWTDVMATAGEEFTIEAGPAGAAVTTFDGTLIVSTTGDGELALGPLEGSVSATTESGDVIGRALRVDEAMVATGTGRIEIDFDRAPDRLTVRAGDAPVVIRLPDAVYAVSVVGASSTEIGVRTGDDAAHLVDVEAQGSVVVEVGR